MYVLKNKSGKYLRLNFVSNEWLEQKEDATKFLSEQSLNETAKMELSQKEFLSIESEVF